MDIGSQVSRMRAEIAKYAGMLSSCLDRKALMRAYQMPRRSDRMYSYGSILQDGCCSCFRSGGMQDGRKMLVYGFGGKVWEPLIPMVFENAVKEALVGSAGAGDFVVKSDWVDKQGKILQYAYDGVSASPLGPKASVVGFQGGVWDFGDIDAPVYHSFEDRMPVLDLLPYDYDADAKCPMWQSFLSQMLSGNDIMKLQKYLGLGAVNRRSMSHRVEDTLWLVGNGANGKSTIMNIVRAVYGYDHVSDASMSQLLDRNPDGRMRALYSIEGRIFNLCDEIDMRDITHGSDAFKKLSSGEPQNVRGIGKDIHVAYDIPFLVFSVNQMPSNRNMDAAFRRRIVRIDFTRTVRDEDMDPELLSKLEKELPGIRNWMMEGYRMLRRDGFLFSHSNDERYMEENEQYFDIFAKAEGLRPSAWAGRGEACQLVRSSELYEQYVAFCDKSLYEPLSSRGMAADLRRLGYRSQRKAAGVFYEVYCDRELDYAVRF